MIKVSVIMITYGHERFIEKAVKSVLMQEGAFDLELIIADDKSPDDTPGRIMEIIASHPRGGAIKYTRHEINKGMQPNFVWAYEQCTGKYVAMCEGDDYWTDPHKIMKQVKFMEENPDYALCGHNAMKLYMNSTRKPTLFTSINKDTDISMEQIFSRWTVPTASFLFRREGFHLPDWFAKLYSGDLSLTLLLRDRGKIRFFAEPMSIYRVNLSGTSASATYSLIFGRRQHKQLFEYFETETQGRYRKLTQKKIKELTKEITYLELKSKSIFLALQKMPLTSFIKIIKKCMQLLKAGN